jgi:hypothetical protein
MIMKKKKKEKKNMMMMMMMMLNVCTWLTLVTDGLPVSGTLFRLLRTMGSYLVIWPVSLIDKHRAI